MQLAASVCTRVCLCAWETMKKWIMESAGSGETKRGVSVNSEAWRDGSCKLAGEWLVGRALQPKQTTEASKQTCERAHTKRRVSMSGIWEHNVYHSPKTHQVLISFLLWVCLCVCVREFMVEGTSGAVKLWLPLYFSLCPPSLPLCRHSILTICHLLQSRSTKVCYSLFSRFLCNPTVKTIS